MSRYVLGESAARKLSALFRGKMATTAATNSPKGFEDNDSLSPFFVQYSSSANALMMRIPSGCWGYSSVADDLTMLTDFPGWFSLPESFVTSLKTDGQIIIYVRGDGGTISANTTSGVPIAVVKYDEGEITIDQFVRSALRVHDELPFAIVGGSVVNCYYRVAGRFRYASDYDLTDSVKGAILAFRIDASETQSVGDGFVIYASYSAMASAADSDLNSYILPLYKFDANGSVVTDLRAIPTASMTEF